MEIEINLMDFVELQTKRIPTMGDEGKTAIAKYLAECLDANVPGEICEFGCFMGESAALMAIVSQRCVWCFDSFEGLPDKTPEDKDCNFKKGKFATPEINIHLLFERYRLVKPKTIKSFFCDLKPEQLPDKIMFAHLDGDLYSSIKQSLELVYPRLSPGAYCLVHDYANSGLPGAKFAVDEFFANKPEKVFIPDIPPNSDPCHCAFKKL